MEIEANNREQTIENISLLSNDYFNKNVNKMAKDMKFFAIFYIVQGVFMSLTVIGAIIGVPIIIYHLKLHQAAKSYQEFTFSNDFYELHKAFENQQKFFFFYKVLLILMIIFIILYICVVIYLFSVGMTAFPENFV